MIYLLRNRVKGYFDLTFNDKNRGQDLELVSRAALRTNLYKGKEAKESGAQARDRWDDGEAGSSPLVGRLSRVLVTLIMVTACFVGDINAAQELRPGVVKNKKEKIEMPTSSQRLAVDYKTLLNNQVTIFGADAATGAISWLSRLLDEAKTSNIRYLAIEMLSSDLQELLDRYSETSQENEKEEIREDFIKGLTGIVGRDAAESYWALVDKALKLGIKIIAVDVPKDEFKQDVLFFRFIYWAERIHKSVGNDRNAKVIVLCSEAQIFAPEYAFPASLADFLKYNWGISATEVIFELKRGDKNFMVKKRDNQWVIHLGNPKK